MTYVCTPYAENGSPCGHHLVCGVPGLYLCTDNAPGGVQLVAHIFSIRAIGIIDISVNQLVSVRYIRRTATGQKMTVEHPLTSSGPYLAFYVSAPLLGVLAGAVAMAGETRITQFLSGIALGTLAVTFLTWVIIDPLASMLETLAPTSREHRLQRLAEDNRQQEERKRNREELLSRLFAQQEQDRRRWQMLLTPDAEKLTVLLTANRANFAQAERQAVGIGVRAWQIGGLDCMRRLHSMAMELYKEKYQNLTITDHISNWWDGIGSWRNTAVGFCPTA